MHWLQRFCAWIEVSDIEVWQSVVDKAMQGAVRTVHVLVDKPRDEVRGESDDKGLEDKKFNSISLYITNSKQQQQSYEPL